MYLITLTNMAMLKDATIVVGVLTLFTLSLATPDSAGIVEMVDGLAYGGIPYGSVSGMLNKYHGPVVRPDLSGLTGQLPHQPNQKYQAPTSPIIITPNYRAAGIARRQRGPVQIYRLPGVIAPGVVGTFSQIGY